MSHRGGWPAATEVFKGADREWLIEQVGRDRARCIEQRLQLRATAYDPDEPSQAQARKAFQRVEKAAKELLKAMDESPVDFAGVATVKMIERHAAGTAKTLAQAGRPVNQEAVGAVVNALDEWCAAGKPFSTYVHPDKDQVDGSAKLVTMVLSALGITSGPRTYLDHYASERIPTQ